MIKFKISIIGNFLKFTNNKQITATIAKHRVPRSNVAGINLIGLMIASVLGTFILASIVKISFTVNDNLQLIKAIAELESSARILDKFFTQTITANGYNVSSSNVNNFVISTDGNNNIKFPLWFTGGGNNAVSCSGQLVPATTTTPVNVAIFMQHPTTASPPTSGYITCNDSGTITPPWAVNDGSSNIPLVSKAQIADFYLVVSVAEAAPMVPTTKMANFPLISSNVKAAQYNAAGIKLAILLKSTYPVFNKSRTVSFNNIFTKKTFSNGTGDSFLYKLVIIQAPFVYAPITGTQTSISS
jgi:Tfp pilus assembly protein PilW